LCTLAPLVDPGPDGSIGQQAEGGSDEEDDNDLVLCRVALEARGRDVIVLFGLAERVAQAELAVAVVAGALCGAGLQRERGVCECQCVCVCVCGGGGGIEGDDGAVAEAGALAKGRGRWAGWVRGTARTRGVEGWTCWQRATGRRGPRRRRRAGRGGGAVGPWLAGGLAGGLSLSPSIASTSPSAERKLGPRWSPALSEHFPSASLAVATANPNRQTALRRPTLAGC
jgi:hypothetical protein